MQFPNEVQAALLFDQSVDIIDGAVRNFLRIEEARSGVRFATPETKPGAFHRLFGGGDELMVTIEYIEGPANSDVFKPALSSTVTTLVCSDMRERLATSRSHILINVSHGVLGSAPDVMRLLQQIDYPVAGHSLPQFRRRLDILALIARIVSDEAQPQAVHWTQSDQLIAGESLEAFAQLPAPGPLHIHPFLYGKAAGPGGKAEVGIRTFGARHFIGREVLVEPSILPWAANYETILAFLKVATVENGYVIPDGDTFGPEDRSLSYRVIHRDAEEGDVPMYVLQPLLHREYGFVAADYVPPERTFDDRSAPAELMPQGAQGAALAEEWREKRAMAERIGGRFEVRARAPDTGTPPTGPAGGFGTRPVFGRKRA